MMAHPPHRHHRSSRMGRQPSPHCRLQPADRQRDPVNGRVPITDQIFPKLSSDKIKLFPRGGRAQLAGLTIWKLNSAWR